MAVELAKHSHAQAVASIQRYFEENFDPIGNVAAAGLLNFMLQEVGPVIYNQAISDAQARMQLRVADLSGELYAEEFQYWGQDAKRRRTR